MQVINRLKSLDAYPKINEDFYSRTLSGGFITLVSTVVMALLFITELSKCVASYPMLMLRNQCWQCLLSYHSPPINGGDLELWWGLNECLIGWSCNLELGSNNALSLIAFETFVAPPLFPPSPSLCYEGLQSLPWHFRSLTFSLMSPHMLSAAELFRFRSRPHILIRDFVLLGGLVRVLRIRVALKLEVLCVSGF